MTPPGESGGDGDGGDGTGFTMLNPTKSEDLSITPKAKNNNGENLVYSEDSNVVNIPLPNSNTNAGGEGGGAKPAGGSSDTLPNIRSSDNSNTFPALANSMFNLAEF